MLSCIKNSFPNVLCGLFELYFLPLYPAPVAALLPVAYQRGHAHPGHDEAQAAHLDDAEPDGLEHVRGVQLQVYRVHPGQKGRERQYSRVGHVDAEEEQHERHVYQVHGEGQERCKQSEDFDVRRKQLVQQEVEVGDEAKLKTTFVSHQ